MRVTYFTGNDRQGTKAYDGEIVSENDSILVVHNDRGGNRTIDKSLIVSRSDQPDLPKAKSSTELEAERKRKVAAQQAQIAPAIEVANPEAKPLEPGPLVPIDIETPVASNTESGAESESVVGAASDSGSSEEASVSREATEQEAEAPAGGSGEPAPPATEGEGSDTISGSGEDRPSPEASELNTSMKVD
jgi:hypothetical protein